MISWAFVGICAVRECDPGLLACSLTAYPALNRHCAVAPLVYPDRARLRALLHGQQTTQPDRGVQELNADERVSDTVQKSNVTRFETKTGRR